MGSGDARRVDVEYLEQPCRSALNPVKGMGFKWSLNPYMGCYHRCTFCYVRAFESRADRPSDDRYGRSIRVKTNIVDVLQAELARPRWKAELVAIGAATDPYQPAEGTYRLTRGCLQALASHVNPASIITRNPLIVRDRDVLVTLASRAELTVNFSIPTLDEHVWRLTEPGSPHPRQRLRAVEMLRQAGIKAGVGMAPILPGISDSPGQLEEVVLGAKAAGAAFVWANVLYLRPGTREHFMESLAKHWPELVPEYERLYRSSYLAKPDAQPILETAAELRRRHHVGERERFLQPRRETSEQLMLLAG